MTRNKTVRGALTFSPAATVAVIHADVWRVRQLSELIQESGARVLLLRSSVNAMQLLPSARCDVVIFGDGLAGPSGPELCELLREGMGDARPWFLRLLERGGAPSASFDVTLPEPVSDETLLVTLTTSVQARRAAAG